MIDDFLTKTINFIFPTKNNGRADQEEILWNNYWRDMIKYFQDHGEIFEINNKWDFYCNEALHSHYKSIVKDFKKFSCIECGCGGGYESAMMATDGANVNVLDYSSEALRYAKIVSQRLGVENKIKFINNDVFDFYSNDLYDLAWNCGVIEHYKDEKIVLIIRKMKSLIKNGGKIAITIPNLLSPQSIHWMLTKGKKSERYISHKKLINIMRNAGLKNVEIVMLNYWLPSFLPYNWAVKISKLKYLNKIKYLPWLFTGIGIK